MSSDPLDASTDAWLVNRMQSGDKEAFTTLFERYNTLVCNYVQFLVRDHHVMQDLAQETFTLAWMRRLSLRDGSRFKGWVCKIAYNQACDYWRRTRRRTEEDIDGLKLHGEGFENRVSEREIIQHAMKQVTPIYRHCLFLYAQGFTKQEIAEQLDLKESSVSTYLSYGRQEFRRAYQRLKNMPDDSERRSDQ
jgi:RNA polymerase sigma-70 factor, ECF subfamily